MKRKFLVWMMVMMMGFVVFSSCKNIRSDVSMEAKTENQILQKDDGTISLNVEKAECYHDMDNPSTNTAEWNVLVSKTGRYNVWLSSATKDTTNLKYKNSVMLSVMDNRIEALPAVDKVVENSSEVSFPYFRADSFIGSLFIQDTGLYNIQVISEKIVPDHYRELSASESSRLISVFFTPAIR
jgi:hypothetical protein